jgi:RNA polymerase sigma factor (sigma-70 family)
MRSDAAVSDQCLVEQVRAGSEPAFEALFDRHHGSVLAFCRCMLRSPAEADDAAQQTFIAAYYDLTRSERPIVVRPWLYAIARHRCLNVLRDRRRERHRDVPEATTDRLTAEVVVAREDLRAVLADISGLPDDQRTALVLAELGDRSHEEIAQAIGCRRDKVKALLFQARASLIAQRAARETACAEVRAQLATLRGAALRRGTLRRHLRECPDCRLFAEALRRQRRPLLLLPLTAIAGLRRILAEALVGAGPGVEGTAIAAGALNAGALAATALAAMTIAGGGSALHAPAPAPRMLSAGNAPSGMNAHRLGVAPVSVASPSAAPRTRVRPDGGGHRGGPTAQADRGDEGRQATPGDGRAPQQMGAADHSTPHNRGDTTEPAGPTATHGHGSDEAGAPVRKHDPTSPTRQSHPAPPIARPGQTKASPAAGRPATATPATAPERHVPAGPSARAQQPGPAEPGGNAATNAATPASAPGAPPAAPAPGREAAGDTPRGRPAS